MRLKKIFSSILILAALMLFASCEVVETKTQTPQERYLELAKKADSLDEFSAIYNFKFSSLGFSQDMPIGIFTKGDKEKVIVEMNLLGTKSSFSSYTINNKSISCISGSLIGEDIETCSTEEGEFSDFESLADFEEFTEEIESGLIIINYTGKRTYIERQCSHFVLEVTNLQEVLDDSEQKESLGNLYGDENASGKFETCLDDETGLDLFVDVSLESTSELIPGGYESVLSMEITSYSDSVDDSIFELPVDFSISKATCYDNNMKIGLEIFNTVSGEVKINLRESSYSFLSEDEEEGKLLETISLGATEIQSGEFRLLSTDYDIPEYTTFDSELCIGDDCQEFECGSFGFTSKEEHSCMQNSNNKVACEADSGCIYNNPICDEFSCFDIQDQAICETKDSCKWSGSSEYGFCTTDFDSLFDDTSLEKESEIDVIQVFVEDTSDGKINSGDTITAFIRLGLGSKEVDLNDILIRLDSDSDSQTTAYSGSGSGSETEFGISYEIEGSSYKNGYINVGDLGEIYFTYSGNDILEDEEFTLRLVSVSGDVEVIDMSTPSFMLDTITYLYP